LKFKNNFLGIRIKGLKTFRHYRAARALHWVLVPSFFVLAASGFYINKPSRGRGFRSMDSARRAHFTAQYFFGLYFLARAYHALVTKNYRGMFLRDEDLTAMPKFAAYEFFLRNKKPKYPKYNPGQKLLFTLMLVILPMQIITGAALYATVKLQKLSRIFGGLNMTRLVHYFTAVGLSCIVAGHMYFALTDSLGKLKSIFTGYFRPK